ncbi:MAG: amidase [Propionibacteriaceae bacterium]|nr:amidase [Propionibacteriaceae bacterium]
MESEGALAGLVVAVKDNIEVMGRRVTAGTRAHQAPVARRDAPCVAKLLEQGARLIGTTNLHALAYGATGLSSDWGVPTNPEAPGCIPGGSSSGSATAVSEKSADLTLGTDTGGSIRTPAALCGVVGFKPTFGHVQTAGVHPLGASLDHIGPLARDVTTVALGYDVLVGAPVGTSLSDEVVGVLSIGVLRGYFSDLITPEVREAFEHMLDRLVEAGVELSEVELPMARHAPAAQLMTLSVEALRSNLVTLRERADRLPADVRIRLEAGLGRDEAGYEIAQQWRAGWRKELARALDRHHVLLSPTVLAPPPRLDEEVLAVDGQELEAQFAATRLTMPFNLSGNPALTIPFRRDAGALAIGLQIVGRHGADTEVLRIGGHLERVLQVPARR